MKYIAANNGTIDNEGEYDFKFVTNEGHEELVVMQIAEVNKALGSVAYFVDRKWRVVFDQDETTGEDVSMMTFKPTGRTTKFRREKHLDS